MTPIPLARLHASLSDPVMGAMSFLNEVMDRYPQAISFAPGAPYAGFFDELDPVAYIERYTRYLAQVQGLTPAQIRKRLYQYGASRGQINGLLAAALRTDLGVEVDPNAIVVTVGCQEAMVLALRALFGQPEDVLAVVNPSFIGISGAARVLDVPMVPVPEGEHGLDCAALLRLSQQLRASGRRLRALYVAPDFSNPSGTLMPLHERQRLLQIAQAEDFLILEDNAYGFTAEPGTEIPTLKALDTDRRVLYLGTCAKICLPGVRVGFVLADQPVDRGAGGLGLLADELAALKSMVTVNTSPICQAIVGGMLLTHGHSLTALGSDKAKLYRHNLGLLLAALERHLGADAQAQGVRWSQPAGGFFVRLSLPVVADNDLLNISASQYGVLWTPMSVFHTDGGGRHELRLSCSYLDADAIDEGVRRFARFLADTRVCGRPEEVSACS